MVSTCFLCSGTGTYNGGVCPICSGDGEIDFTDSDFKYIRASHKRLLTGVVWDAILKALADTIVKLEGVDVKLDALDAKLDVINDKIDGLE